MIAPDNALPTPHITALCPQADSELPAAFDSAGLQAFLERLSDFDIAMNRVVVESGVLAGKSLRLQKTGRLAGSCAAGV